MLKATSPSQEQGLTLRGQVGRRGSFPGADGEARKRHKAGRSFLGRRNRRRGGNRAGGRRVAARRSPIVTALCAGPAWVGRLSELSELLFSVSTLAV